LHINFLVFLLLALISISLFSVQDAAADIFLKIDTIPGEAKEPHLDEIDILSFSFGLDSAVTSIVGQVRGAASASFQDATFTKLLDKSSPKLFLDVATGNIEPEAILVVTRQTGEGPVNILVLTLTDVLVTSYSIGGSAGGGIPVETISLNFAKFFIDYILIDEKGAGATTSSGFDIEQNRPTSIPTSDSDGDGVPNAQDICPGFNDNLDADFDGVPDGCDICPGADDNVDTDGDGIPDACDTGQFCGDGLRNGIEVCEGADLGGTTCDNLFGFTGGTLACTATCGFDTSACTAGTTCGDGLRNGLEVCEGADLGGTTCANISGFTGGTLTCDVFCGFDTSACIISDTGQITGSVEILTTCGLQFVSGSPINYGGILPGAESLEQQLVLDNTGNTALTTLFVRGLNWVDSGGLAIMDVSDSRFSTSSIPYGSKIILGLADKTVTSAFDPVANLITYWQLTANLLESSFAGDLSQTLDFTVSC